MQDYNDIQLFERVDDLSALDLRQEIQECQEQGLNFECHKASAFNAEAIEILWIPAISRAGIAWGADAQWTDAESPHDALERYFGVDSKTMEG